MGQQPRYGRVDGCSSETAGPDENNVVAGFMGAALRNVDTGAYVASVRHPCTGGCSGQREQVSMESGFHKTVLVNNS